jgi:hypothetical protein
LGVECPYASSAFSVLGGSREERFENEWLMCGLVAPRGLGGCELRRGEVGLLASNVSDSGDAVGSSNSNANCALASWIARRCGFGPPSVEMLGGGDLRALPRAMGFVGDVGDVGDPEPPPVPTSGGIKLGPSVERGELDAASALRTPGGAGLFLGAGSEGLDVVWGEPLPLDPVDAVESLGDRTTGELSGMLGELGGLGDDALVFFCMPSVRFHHELLDLLSSSSLAKSLSARLTACGESVTIVMVERLRGRPGVVGVLGGKDALSSISGEFCGSSSSYRFLIRSRRCWSRRTDWISTSYDPGSSFVE